MSKTLATIIKDAPVEFDFAEAKLESIQSLYTENAYLMCKRLEFKNLLGRFQVDAPKNDAAEYFRRITTEKEADKIWKKTAGKDVAFFFAEGNLALAFGEQDIYFFEMGDGMSSDGLSQKIGELSRAVVDSKTVRNRGISRRRVIFGHSGRAVRYKVFGHSGSSVIRGTAGRRRLKRDKRNGKCNVPVTGRLITHDLKTALHFFNILGEGADSAKSCAPSDFDTYLKIRSRYFDTMVAAYLLNPLKGEYPYEDIAKDYLGLMVPSKADLLGKMSITEARGQEPEKLMQWACYEAYVAWKSYAVLLEKLKEEQMDRLFFDMEMPVVFVLSDMEKEGICMDAAALQEYGEKLSVSIAELEQKIYTEAGEEFNINSPKQLGVILFEKLGMPNGKKTKTGYSTSAEVLDGLANDYPIVADILEYRQLTKLKSTYADGLLHFVDESGRIHTTFNQTITATGRLSSTDPNLQNIPIRIELGRLIRKVFHPADGYVFVDSDYSQIELRVLAHMSGDAMLIEAFKNGQDIHRTTASQVFHVPFDEVTPLQRRNAKAVNFGIVYGISAFGLAKDLNISKKEAQAYIDSYFATYPGIKKFLDDTVENAKKEGMIRTMFGRIRPVPELSSSNFMQRQFGERVAMNSPIQGTAADIIKIAMIRVHDALLREKRKSKLLLQVHDELLIETAEDEKDDVIRLLEEEMQQAAELSCGLSVGTECGKTWYDAH
jgi:DNA polymerase-1